eukprot:CAMPEP_0116962764 /NCGR_PEP_ID=MMETSP0467-20121206/47489_1 /TAXON_ID=283647 /ORGANISM="Mesodinium pulex, Strain SPMC105" /LENGTH=177 /DNA_ID=CAMNT_0004651223 /DNA_START=300 /DNA_END=833 /DNA_ORIENTATION=-
MAVPQAVQSAPVHAVQLASDQEEKTEVSTFHWSLVSSRTRSNQPRNLVNCLSSCFSTLVKSLSCFCDSLDKKFIARAQRVYWGGKCQVVAEESVPATAFSTAISKSEISASDKSASYVPHASKSCSAYNSAGVLVFKSSASAVAQLVALTTSPPHAVQVAAENLVVFWSYVYIEGVT